MNPRRLVYLLPMLLLTLAAPTLAHAVDLFGSAPDQGPHVHARLVADTTAVEPGRPFRLGVLYTMDPEWHIYWINGGEVGYATDIDWNLPEGFTPGALQWPVPERIEQLGLVSYAYPHQVLLFTTVTPPETLPEGPMSLKAKTSWLACREACIPGEQAVALNLPQGPGQPSAEAALFDQYAALVPSRSLDEPVEGLTVKVEPAKLPPVLNAPLDVSVTLQAAEGWQIDAADPSVNGLYPLNGPTWQSTYPRLIAQDAVSLTYDWKLTPLEITGQVGELSAVVSVLLKNTASGETRRVVGTYRFVTDPSLTGATPATATSSTAPVIPVKVEPAPTASPAGSAQTAVADQGPGEGGAPRGLSFLGKHTETHSLAWYLLMALLGGVILNVMPCVLPVISLKVLGFVKQSGESRARVLELGVAFTVGVLVSFLALALVAVALKLAGSQAGWGFQFQEPRFVLVLAAIVLVFGLSLFGVFEINLPVSGRGGLAGAFFNGVLATVLATPCTAPLMGPALGFAFNQPPATIVLFFLTIGLGLALPYLLLSMNPAWLRFLPRPGMWMEHFKQFMGFLMLGTLIFLLWVLGGQIGNDGLMRAMSFLLGLALACWLIGLGWDGRSTARRRWVLTILALAVTVGSYADPAGFMARQRAAGMSEAAPVEVNTASSEGIDWQPFSVDLVEDLASQGRTVFLDFTANWCLTCQYNEKTVLETDSVRQAFAKYHVVAVKADWTRRDRAIGTVLGQFGRSGVPLYVILPAGRPSEPIVLDTILTNDAIDKALTRASSLNP